MKRVRVTDKLNLDLNKGLYQELEKNLFWMMKAMFFDGLKSEISTELETQIKKDTP